MGKRVVLISHGTLAEGMESAVEMVFGASDRLSAACLAPDGSCIELVDEIRRHAAAESDEQFIVIADIFGGSVCNQCMQQILSMPNVKLISGMCLGLVLGVLASPGELSDPQIESIIQESKQGTRLVPASLISERVTSGEEDFF